MVYSHMQIVKKKWQEKGMEMLDKGVTEKSSFQNTTMQRKHREGRSWLPSGLNGSVLLCCRQTSACVSLSVCGGEMGT